MSYSKKHKIDTLYLQGWSYTLPWDKSFESLEPIQKDKWAKDWLTKNKQKSLSQCHACAIWDGERIVGIRVDTYDYTKDAY